MSLRRGLNRLLKQYGYKVIKRDFFIDRLAEEFERVDEFCFIQIGANDGVKFDNLYSFVTSHKCKGIVIEPLSYYYEKLKFNYRRHPDIVAINSAVHSVDKTAAMYFVDPEVLDSVPEWAEGIGSLDPNHHKKSETLSEHIIHEEVRCAHLMDIIAENKCEQVNLLQIDVEGYDAEVIKMIDFSIITPSVIKFEHVNLDENVREEAEEILKSQGYEIFRQGYNSIAVYPLKKRQSV